jgi:hypothetical protein
VETALSRSKTQEPDECQVERERQHRARLARRRACARERANSPEKAEYANHAITTVNPVAASGPRRPPATPLRPRPKSELRSARARPSSTPRILTGRALR